MTMRTVLFAAAIALGLPGCATVSMVPASAVVEANLSEDKTRLRDISDAYIKRCEDAKWVSQSGGLLDFARMLMDGASDQAKTAERYADFVGADRGQPSEIYLRVSEDIAAADAGLQAVKDEAKLVLSEATGETRRLRADLMSFEASLVTAQKAHKAFAEAINIASERGEYGREGANQALEAFSKTIDEARLLADRMADISLAALGDPRPSQSL
ncbi:MAG: hypothetical protein AAGF20_08265 [Pseudomonadota bacterium]